MVAAAQINGRMSHRIPLWRVLRTANTIQLGAGLLLLASDVVTDPFVPVDGWLTPRRPHVDARVLASA